MREYCSGSQILFGYLPDQTVDLSGRVWRVVHWNRPIPQAVDDTALREELLRQSSAWERTGRDGDFVQDLRRGMALTVYALNYDAGVKVESFPQVWICRRCARLETSNGCECRCGTRHWGQLPFVGYHDCGSSAAIVSQMPGAWASSYQTSRNVLRRRNNRRLSRVQ